MSINVFSWRAKGVQRLFVPPGYRKTVKWLPQIGDIFPNFEATTTAGTLRFFDWAEGSWTFLFSHPSAFTPVCTSEVVAMASAAEEFAQRNVRLLAFSRSPIELQQAWFAQIEEAFGVRVDFPGVEDATGQFGRSFGMVHPHESGTCPIRKSFILDPDMRIRMIFEYPMGVGRSTDEVLRCIDALQLQRSEALALPADWQPGDLALQVSSNLGKLIDLNAPMPLRLYISTVETADHVDRRSEIWIEEVDPER